MCRGLWVALWVSLVVGGCEPSGLIRPVRALEVEQQFQTRGYAVRDEPPSRLVFSYSPTVGFQVFAWVLIIGGVLVGLFFATEEDETVKKLLLFVIPSAVGGVLGAAILTGRQEHTINTERAEVVFVSSRFGSSEEQRLPFAASRFHVVVDESTDSDGKSSVSGYSLYVQDTRKKRGFFSSNGTRLAEFNGSADADELRDYLESICGEPTLTPQ